MDLMILRQVFSSWALVSLPRAGSTMGNHGCSSWHGNRMFCAGMLLWSVLHGRKWDSLSLENIPKQEALGVGLDAKLLQTRGNNGVQKRQCINKDEK